MYMDNNPLAYVRESKLGAAQIRLLSKLADALRNHPYVPGEMDSNSDCDEYETISYATVCEELKEIINGKNSP